MAKLVFAMMQSLGGYVAGIGGGRGDALLGRWARTPHLSVTTSERSYHG
jgi:hypothetical protein